MEACGAVFILGSIKALTWSQDESITLFQTIGNQGILSIVQFDKKAFELSLMEISI